MLLQELLPGLDEPQRFQARMIASALGIAAREAEAGDQAWQHLRATLGDLSGQPESELANLLPTVAAEVRQGRWDGDKGLYEVLRQHIRARLAIANPKALPEV